MYLVLLVFSFSIVYFNCRSGIHWYDSHGRVVKERSMDTGGLAFQLVEH
jgi:hypothetical protein